MPQLDIVTFLPNFFWFVLTFFSFYILLAKYFLPKVARIRAVRWLKSVHFSESAFDMNAMRHLTRSRYAKVFLPPFFQVRQDITTTVDHSAQWMTDGLQSLNASASVNQAYLASLRQSLFETLHPTLFLKFATSPKAHEAAGLLPWSRSEKEKFYNYETFFSLSQGKASAKKKK